jgi:hypothetical protein
MGICGKLSRRLTPMKEMRMNNTKPRKKVMVSANTFHELTKKVNDHFLMEDPRWTPVFGSTIVNPVTGESCVLMEYRG